MAGSTSPRCARRRRRGRAWREWIWRRKSPVSNPTTGTKPPGPGPPGFGRQTAPKRHVVAVDYGAKRNILRCLAAAGCRVTVVPATASAEDILRHQPDGVFLSNGPGDPAATGDVRGAGDPGRAGAGHSGVRDLPRPSVAGAGAWARRRSSWTEAIAAPISRCKDLTTGKVEITSQNHGFAVDLDTLAAVGDADATCRCSTARTRGWPAPTGRRSACNTIRRRVPGPSRQPLSVPALRRDDRPAGVKWTRGPCC